MNTSRQDHPAFRDDRQPGRQTHKARKRFGQNFLVAEGIIRQIVDTIAPQPDDTLIEIGPGLGALTGPLLQRTRHLHVVEIDRDLIVRLKKRPDAGKLTIHEGDALKLDFGALGAGHSLRIVGNLPYNISTPLLFHLEQYVESIRDMHFMLQKEVVDRMVAAPGGSDYGRLSVMLQYHFHMDRMFLVPPEAFDPAPKVESAIVRMIPRPAGETPDRPEARDPALFARVVTTAFSQRRKMLRNTLRELVSETELSRLGIAPTARAEDIPLADYVRLANSLTE